jgi:hypothetical protein
MYCAVKCHAETSLPACGSRKQLVMTVVSDVLLATEDVCHGWLYMGPAVAAHLLLIIPDAGLWLMSGLFFLSFINLCTRRMLLDA